MHFLLKIKANPPVSYWKFPVLLFFLYLLPSCNQPKEFPISIIGEADINETTVRLTNQDRSVTYDSTIVKNKQFTLHTDKITDGFYFIDFKNSTPTDSITNKWSHQIEIYIEEGKEYSLYAKDQDDILQNSYTIQSNSEDQNKLNKYKQLYKTYQDSLKQMRTRLIIARDQTLYEEPFYGLYTDSILDTETKMQEAPATLIHHFISNNNNTILIPRLINSTNNYFYNYNFYKEALDKLNKDYKSKPETKKAYKNLKGASELHLGTILPEIAGKDTSGNPYSYDFSNKKLVLVNFWASWSISSRTINPELKDLYEKYKGQGFDIISVSMDQTIPRWKNAIIKDKLTWTNICEGLSIPKSINYERFNTKSLPLNYLVNNEGKIIAKNVDAYSLEKILQN